MLIRVNDGRGVIDVDADIIRGELGFTNFYKRSTTTLRREAITIGMWPFRRTIPARDEQTSNEAWVLSLATNLIVEMRPPPSKKAKTPKKGRR